MLKFCARVIISFYLIITLLSTVFIFSYNDNNVPQLFGYSFLTVDKEKADILAEHNLLSISSGDLVLVRERKANEINILDKVFYYKNTSSGEFDVASVVDVRDNSGVTTFVLDNDYYITESNLVGKVNDTKIYDFLGFVLLFFENKIGYIPLLLLLIYASFMIFYKIEKGKFARSLQNEKVYSEYSDIEVLDI